MKYWDHVVWMAWLGRTDHASPRYHPGKAARMYARFTPNIERAQRYVTAENMVRRHKYSSYSAYQRAVDHAFSYSTDAWQRQYWLDVGMVVLKIQREEV